MARFGKSNTMIYYANGCSFTWGGSLYEFRPENDVWLPRDVDHPLNKERLNSVYPYHLGKLIKASKVINDSMGCGSNYRIIRTTLNYFNNLISKGIPINDHFVTIQWTEPSRFEYYDEITNTWNMLTTVTFVSESGPEHPSNAKKVHDFYYKNIYSTKQSHDIFISHITCLGSFFQKHNIPYLFYTHTNFWLDYFTETEDFDHFNNLVSRFNWWGDIPSHAYMSGGKVDSPFGAHPSKKGHQQWAQLVFEDIKKKNLLQHFKNEAL